MCTNGECYWALYCLTFSINGLDNRAVPLPMVHTLEEGATQFKLQMLQQHLPSAERNVRLVMKLGCVLGGFWPPRPLGCVWGRDRPVGSRSPGKRGGAESWAVLVVPPPVQAMGRQL